MSEEVMNINLSFDLKKFEKLIEGKLEVWLEEAIKLIPNFIVAVLTFILFLFIAKIAGRLFANLTRRIVDSEAVINLLTSILKVAVAMVGFFVALDFLGLKGTVTSLLAGAGIIGLAIGFAFQDMTENLISGMTMSIRKPFKIGDVIETNDIWGEVKKINLRNTTIETFSGQYVMIPNKMVFRNIVTNYNSKGQRRIEIPVGISYADSPDVAAEVITKAINEKPYVINPQETGVYATGFADSSINLVVWYWIDYPGEHGYMDVLHDGISTVKKSLEEADILIPFPIRTLDFGIKGGEKLSGMLSSHKADS
jgi:small-conductance mechanosensitive channel